MLNYRLYCSTENSHILLSRWKGCLFCCAGRLEVIVAVGLSSESLGDAVVHGVSLGNFFNSTGASVKNAHNTFLPPALKLTRPKHLKSTLEKCCFNCLHGLDSTLFHLSLAASSLHWKPSLKNCPTACERESLKDTVPYRQSGFWCTCGAVDWRWRGAGCHVTATLSEAPKIFLTGWIWFFPVFPDACNQPSKQSKTTFQSCASQLHTIQTSWHYDVN